MEPLLIALIRLALRILYSFRSFNESVLRTPGPVLLLSNHVSWWDWLFIGSCLEPDWRFVTSSATAQLSPIHRWILVNRRTFPVDMNSPYAVKHIAEYLHKGGRLVLFPEGRMSTTGSLMKLFEGTGFLVGKTHAKIITAFLRGAGRLPFSPNPNRKQWFPRVSLHLTKVLEPPVAPHAASMETRLAVADWLRDQMVQQQFQTEMEFGHQTLPRAIEACARANRSRTAIEDTSQTRLKYGSIITRAAVLTRIWDQTLDPSQKRVGLLLPNVNAFPVVLLSLWAAGRVPAILNYSSGPATLAACARIAGLKQVVTSRKFIEKTLLDTTPLRTA
ncbi:MAG TPA: 1-acyl-sn-glycerol-3-phosphate acyltransferase, partial [Verrucomicrobiae bacterium]|nr:1-acyl-sn-glycerol-3-phosphate acyltransferase [Verrucomicrobiae bacterium]